MQALRNNSGVIVTTCQPNPPAMNLGPRVMEYQQEEFSLWFPRRYTDGIRGMQMGQLTQAFRFLREIFDLTELPLTQAFTSQKINTPQEFLTYVLGCYCHLFHRVHTCCAWCTLIESVQCLAVHVNSFISISSLQRCTELENKVLICWCNAWRLVLYV